MTPENAFFAKKSPPGLDFALNDAYSTYIRYFTYEIVDKKQGKKQKNMRLNDSRDTILHTLLSRKQASTPLFIIKACFNRVLSPRDIFSIPDIHFYQNYSRTHGHCVPAAFVCLYLQYPKLS